MTILSIGNSFSQDAQRYLSGIAHAAGEDILCVNPFIGGCSLWAHYRNILSDAKSYSLEFCGRTTGFQVSLNEALLARNWDVVTIQQCSPESIHYDSFQPYLSAISEHVHKLCPKAKQMIHQHWAYGAASERLPKMGFSGYDDMFAVVKANYDRAAKEIGAEVMPSGEVIGELLRLGADPLKVHRDCHHIGYGLGRYAVGLLWFAVLTGKPVRDNSFRDFDQPISEEEVALAKTAVENVLARI